MKPYYSDARVTVHAGDCLDVLRELDDASIDAVVTDPPYGLEFMGKEWDGADGFRRSMNPADVGRDSVFGRTSATSPEYRSNATASRSQRGGHSATDGRPSFLGGLNPKCLGCDKWQRGANPCRCESPKFTNERLPRLHTFQQWCELWATECLRVLKPGGHMLAFGGTRTWHRLACAIEDAGFEVRDSIAWLYGSGFPKSLDVSKAIDKANGKPLERLREFGSYVRAAREAASLTQTEVNRSMGMPQGCGWWEGKGAGAKWDLHLPSVATWASLKTVIPTLDDEWDWFIEWAEAERAVVGERTTGIGTGRGSVAYIADSDNRDVTAPATDDARTWQGWGTALKPSHEPVVVAFKPLDDLALLARIGSHLDTLEQTWQAQEADPTTRTGEAGDSPAATDTSWSESATTTPSNTVTSWRACWVELCELTSTSITSTTSETTTVLRTLLSSISRLTDTSTPVLATSPPGSTSIASAVDNLFASAVCASRATLALSATEPATSSTPPSRRDAAARTAFEPIVVARRPLTGTVAANVLAHGTGALNIDGCRIGETVETWPKSRARPNNSRDMHHNYVDGGSHTAVTGDVPAGRWPANVVLDESQAAALDATTGEQRDGVAVNRNRDGDDMASWYGTRNSQTGPDVGYGGTGGASRYFYTAKAPGTERVKLNGTAHPTVKPLDLMRWLVRLVTPPNGIVLDPFAGSGTTVEACILEGFRCIAIEREPDYLPLIMQRINRRIDPVAAVKAADDDGGLFDLLGEGIA